MQRRMSELLITLAKNSICHYLETGLLLTPPADLPAAFHKPGAVFVTLNSADGKLRGCRGVLSPTTPTLVEEIITTAVASATDDPRFPPLTLPEMVDLQIKIDVLSAMEPVQDIGQLDEKIYGVVIRSGSKRAVLLPDIAAVQNVSHQLELVRRKAGLIPEEPAELYRFTVTRYYLDRK